MRLKPTDALTIIASELAATIVERDQALARVAELERRLKQLESSSDTRPGDDT